MWRPLWIQQLAFCPMLSRKMYEVEVCHATFQNKRMITKERERLREVSGKYLKSKHQKEVLWGSRDLGDDVI